MQTVTDLRRSRRITNGHHIPEMKRRAHRAMRRWIRQQDLTRDYGTPPRTKRCTDFDVI